MAKKKPKEVSASTIAEFAKHVEGLLPTGNGAGNWYRGVGKSKTYKLTPGLYRHPTVKLLEDFIRLEANMLADFERHSILHTAGADINGDEANFKKLFFMQHYGIPTRLLDWSTNPFIALYFALSTASVGVGAEDAAVWVLDPMAWNRASLSHASHGDAGPLTHTDAALNYGPRRLYHNNFNATDLKTLNEGAACLLGITNNVRMFAQRGVFTIFGKDTAAMEDQYGAYSHAAGSLTKIVIPAAKVTDALSSLIRMGYTDSVSYPDLHGLAMEIRRSRGFAV
jgi:hypothetical protein